jgi:hypothetical protein
MNSKSEIRELLPPETGLAFVAMHQLRTTDSATASAEPMPTVYI